MGKYKIEDFNKGDKVYHLSNTKLMMVALEIYEDMNEVECRWLDSAGKIQIMAFFAEELGKSDDLRPPFTISKISY